MTAMHCGDGDAPGQWRFWRSKDRAWRWRQVNLGGACRISRAAFQSLTDCMANAIYHGYVPPSDTDDATEARGIA